MTICLVVMQMVVELFIHPCKKIIYNLLKRKLIKTKKSIIKDNSSRLCKIQWSKDNHLWNLIKLIIRKLIKIARKKETVITKIQIKLRWIKKRSHPLNIKITEIIKVRKNKLELIILKCKQIRRVKKRNWSIWYSIEICQKGKNRCISKTFTSYISY